MKKMVDKKGAFSVQYFIGMIVAGAALVIVLIGLTQGWGFFGTLFSFAPDDLTQVASACKGYASQESLALDYCKYRKLTIDDKKQWVNCDYIHIRASDTLEDGAGFTKKDEGYCKVTPKKYCEELAKKDGYDGTKVIVNGKPCYKKEGVAGTDHWDVRSA